MKKLIDLQRSFCNKIHKLKTSALETLVLESIAYPYMDFQKSTVIHMDIHDLGMSVFKSRYKCGYPH